jgi:hypothetical protein
MEACHARLAEPQSFVENPVRNGVFSFTPNVTALAGFSNSYFLTENLPTPSLKFVPFTPDPVFFRSNIFMGMGGRSTYQRQPRRLGLSR